MKKGLTILTCIIVAVLVGLLTIYILNIRKDKEATDYLTGGLAKYNRGDYQGAVSDFDAALQINPDYAEAYNNRGRAKTALGQYQQAIADYEMALQINPDYAEAYNNRGRAKTALGDYKGAISDYDTVLTLNPDYAEAYSNRAKAKIELGDYKGAVSDLDAALRLDPDDPQAYSNRAKAKIELGDYKGAVSDLDAALRLDPDDPQAYSNRAKAKIELGDYKGAVSDLDAALRLDPDDPQAYSNRAKAKIELGDYKGAVSDLDAALRLDPDDPQAYSNRAKAKIELGDYKGAVSDLDAALRLDPDDPQAYKDRDMVQAAADDMVLIPAEEFQMGRVSEDNSGRTQGSMDAVYVQAFYIDKYLVTNAQYKAFIDANPEWQKENYIAKFNEKFALPDTPLLDGDEDHSGFADMYLVGWRGNEHPPDQGDYPVLVHWHAAMAYAQWAGKRLPTAAEWEKAARGGMVGKRYPWGDTTDVSKVNRRYLKDSGYSLRAPIGRYPPNEYGLYDMVGGPFQPCISNPGDNLTTLKYSYSPFGDSFGWRLKGSILGYLHGGFVHEYRSSPYGYQLLGIRCVKPAIQTKGWTKFKNVYPD